MAGVYPLWQYYPVRDEAPPWVTDFTDAVAAKQSVIDSLDTDGLTSDAVLAALRPGLEQLGYLVESGKRKADRIQLPVLFGEQGAARVQYEVDAVNRDLGVVVEVEAGRGARGNAVYRDIVRTSLIVGARYLALGVMAQYRHMSKGRAVAVNSFADAKAVLDAVYSSNRLTLPFEGVLLFGY